MQGWTYQTLGNITNPRKIMVFLHGLGSNLEYTIDLAHKFLQEFPDYCAICVNAQDQYNLDSSENSRYQWFSTQDKSPSGIRDQTELGSLKLQKFLDAITQKHNLGHKDLILIGFSQGGMIASYIGSKIELFCVIGFASCFIYPKKRKIVTTPMCFIHGAEDEIISLQTLEGALEMSKEYELKYEKIVVKNLKHAIDSSGIDKAKEFIKKVPSIKLQNYSEIA